MTSRRSVRDRRSQLARRLIAAFSVCAPSWNRYSGQMSSVPPARSIRVGADAWMCTAKSYIACDMIAAVDVSCAISAAMSVSSPSSGSTATRCRTRSGSLAREFDLGGVIFFARNVETPEQVADLSRESQELAAEIPLWVSVDQEGGRVARLKRPFTEWPPMTTLGRAGRRRTTQLAERFAQGAGRRAPRRRHLARLHAGPRRPHQPEEPGDRRSRAGRARRGRRAPRRRIIRTLQGAGIAACGKHFPGHGDTSTDSHFELPLLDHPPDRLEAVELVPFKAAIAADVASIMTAHILIPSLDEELPGTLSPAIVDGLLKKKLGYQGLVLSDDLEMKAISGRYGHSEATVQAIAAGCDAVLMCAPAPGAADGGARGHHLRGREGPHSAEARRGRARAAPPREGALPRAAAPRPATGAALRAILGRDEHQAVAAEMARFA